MNGLHDEKKDSISFRANGVVTISDLDSTTSKVLIDAIHGKTNFGRKLYCNGVIPLTPEKPSTSPGTPAGDAPQGTVGPPGTSPSTATGTTATSPPIISTDLHVTAAIDPPPNKSPAFLAAVQTFENLELPSNSDVVRIHSLSSINRTPPMDSIAAQILGSLTPRPDLLRTKSMLSELRDLTERLSDFGSCLSSSSDENSGEENSEIGGFKTMNELKRIKKKKRKLKLTPGKESFLKKPNLDRSSS